MEQAGPQLLRHWIDRAAARDPDKAFIVAADDGRTLTYGQLRALTGRIATYLRDQGVGANDRIALLSNNSIEHLAAYFGVLAYGATICTVHVEMNRNQLDNILPVLKPRMVLCEDGLGLDDMLKAVSAPCLPLGAWDDRRGDSFFAAVNRCEPGDAAHRCRRGRQRCHPVHLGHQRAAQGRGAELPRASVQRRADRRRLQHDGAGPHLRFPLVQLVLGADLERGAAALPRRDLDPRAQILAQPVLRSHPAIRRDDRDRQPDHHRHPAQRRCAGRAGTADAPLHDVELGAAHGRRVAALRGAFRHPRLRRDMAAARSAGSRRSRASSAASARSAGRTPITGCPSSAPKGRCCKRGEIGRGRARRVARQRLPHARRRRLAPRRLSRAA